MSINIRTLALLLLTPTAVFAQTRPSTAEEVEKAARDRQAQRAQSILRNYPARPIGPTIQGGRVTDIDVDPRDVHTWYVGYASGGLFKTTNNGQTFTPIFDGQAALGIGDIAISPANPDIIWVGTGENNSSRSSYAGAGVFRSTDAGKTWAHVGLGGTQHLGRIIAHPSDPNTAWVASIGALYTENDDRGVFLTTDGGATWTKTLNINPRTGIIDLVLDPHNPQQLWAAAWERSRKAWEFDEDGPGSGIYRSTDGGRTWQKLTGLPTGETVGRFGIAASPARQGLLYAVLDNQETDPKLVHEDTIAGLTSRAIAAMTQEAFLKLPDARLDSFLRESGYPSKYTAKLVKEEVQAGKYGPKELGQYFGDANKALFETAVKGTELYRSTDNGTTWAKVHSEALTGVYYTYGYYFGQVRTAPDRPDEVYTYGVPLIRSTDGGKTWARLDTTGDVHVDHHALWINPRDGNHQLLGNDGGIYITYDRGVNWTHIHNLPVGQFYTVAVDMEDPYNVYGGLQDNGVLKGSSRSVPNRSPDWKYIGGGDGMFVVVDPRNSGTYYTGYQFGHYYRYGQGRPVYITPQHDIGTEKYRWNWRTPLVASPHNHEILYIGAQKLFRTMDMGGKWEALSPDLTTNRQPQGNVPYSTITTISESPLKFGQIWVGTDDGKVQLTTDGGNTWKDASAGLPTGLWVSSLQASSHDKGTAFLTLTGYRADDFHAYLYRTTDHGTTWTSLRANLPDEGANILIQDPVEPKLLYLGTDHATYASLDGGASWHSLATIPNVAGYDMIVHPRDHEWVVATHGRSVYIVDVQPLRQFAKRETGQRIVAFTPPKTRHSTEWGKRDHPYQEFSQPKVYLTYFLAETPSSPVTLRVLDDNGKEVHTLTHTGVAGWNVAEWGLRIKEKGKETYLRPGKYQIEFKLGAETRTVDWVVE